MNNIINFNDQEFEKYIRDYLGKISEEITVQDMEKIQYLDLGFRIFTDVSSIAYCKNLKQIHFAEDFSEKYDLQILKELHNIHSISIVNPKADALAELYKYVKFTSLDIMYWGNVDICDLNTYTEMRELSVLNFTGKAFSCKNIRNLTGLQYLRLCSTVTDAEVLNSLSELKVYRND